MLDPKKLYHRRLTGVSTWVLKAVGLVIAGAATVIVAMTITRSVSTKVEPAPGGKFVGIRHDAGSITHNPAVSAPSPTQTVESSPDTIMQNGVTVVTPELKVPVIDLRSLEAATAQTEPASIKTSSSRKRTRYASRTVTQHHPRWKAYGLAIR